MQNSIKKVRLNTESSILYLEDGCTLDCRPCRNIGEIRDKFVEEFIPLCRRYKTGHTFCLRVLKGREERPCPLQVRFLDNYFSETIKYIPKNSAYHVKEYLSYLVNLLLLVDKFNHWQGGILQKDILNWQGEAILRLDKYWLKEINLELAKVIKHYIPIEPIDRSFYRYKIFVEGIDDEKAIKKVGESIRFHLFEENVEILKGEGNVKNNLRYIKKLILDGLDIFFLMDNEGRWYSHIKKDLINTQLIKEDQQVYRFRKALEDSYPKEVQRTAFSNLEKLPDDIKGLIDEKFFRIRSQNKVVDRLQKKLFKVKVDFKKNFKERFNQNLLNTYLKDMNRYPRSELLRCVRRLEKTIKKRRNEFYKKYVTNP